MREIAHKVGVLDRIVDRRHAVLIVGDPPEQEITVPVHELPSGIREGHWLRLTLDGDRLVDAAIDHALTEAARKRVHSKMEQLRRRGRKLGGG